MMRNRFTLPLLALGLTAFAAPAAAQSVNDFQLPPNPSPSPTPRAQGPVDDSGVVPVAPRTIPTASPTRASPPASAPSQSATQAPAPRPTAAPQAAATPRSPFAAQSQRPAASPAQQPAQDATGPAASLPTALPEFSASPAAPAPAPAVDGAPPASEVPGGPLLPDWWWIAALVAAAIAAVAGLLLWRRRSAGQAVPEIVRPVVGDAGMATLSDDPLRYLKVEIDAVRLARSMMAATLTYRITLSNRASEAIRAIMLDGDLTSAHGAAPISEQLADTLTALPPLHTLDHLGAGQRKSFTGEIRLPLKDVRPIRQGNVPIYIPLLRLKASAAGAEPKAFTFVVGKAPDLAGARLQPFRLDTPPQTFNAIDARPLG
jgi:hypothetical protein